MTKNGYIKFAYRGVVLKNGHTVRGEEWYGETHATNAVVAENNLKYQYKKQHRLPLNTRITLPGLVKKRL